MATGSFGTFPYGLTPYGGAFSGTTGGGSGSPSDSDSFSETESVILAVTLSATDFSFTGESTGNTVIPDTTGYLTATVRSGDAIFYQRHSASA